MFPKVNLQADKLITDENGIYTNGGAYSFLNLIIYLVEKYYDRQTAIYCSKIFQIELDRQSQSPFTIFTGQKLHGDEIVKKAQAYIENKLNEKISVKHLSSMFAVGRRNFDRRFIKATGNTPVEYCQRVKIEAAKKAFETTSKTINEVMYEVGYSDVKAFREVFRKITGMSPLEYRGKYNKDVVVNGTLTGVQSTFLISTEKATMNYQTFQPHSDLKSLIKCHWTLEVPAQKDTKRQLIIPDGCIEMIFILGDDVKRYTSEDKFIIQPREMVLGQITEPFFIEPTGYVNSFAVRFYPYGFTNFVSTSIKKLANKETPIALLFGENPSKELGQKIAQATDTKKRIEIIEGFLSDKLNDKSTIDNIVKTTIDTILLTKGGSPINTILKDDLSKRRQLERKFTKQIGISPKQLGKVIRLQAALQMLLNRQSENLTMIAYESEYYDQAHFIKDFKEFTGTTPKEFLEDDKMSLSSILYKKN